MTSMQNNVWFVNLRKNPGARLRLFCFPHAGGGAGAFKLWPALLPPDLEIYAVQLPGRENRFRETPITQMQPLVETLGQMIRPLLDKPFAFFGHSLGSLVSFELTRLLRCNSGVQPVHLFVSGCHAPQLHRNSNTHQLPESEFIQKIKKLNGIPAEILNNQEMMLLILPTLYADFTIFETYRYLPEPALDCPVSAFGGLQDREVPKTDLDAWRQQTRKQFSLHMFTGDHFFLNTAQQLLLKRISAKIAPYISW